MGKLFACVANVLGMLVTRHVRISVGSNSSIRWWALRGARGGRIVVGRSSMIRCRIAFDDACGEVRIGDRCYLGASHLVCHTSITQMATALNPLGTFMDGDQYALAALSEDHREAVAAFFEKRPPRFIGR